MDKKIVSCKIKDFISGIFFDIKGEKSNIRSSFSQFGAELRLRSKAIVAPQNRKGLFVDFLAVILIGLVVSLLCSVKSGGMDLFLSVMIPFSVIGVCLFAFTAVFDSSVTYTTLTVILVLLGAALQIMLMLPVEDASGAYKLAVFAGVGTLVGLTAVPFFNYLFNSMGKRLAVALTLCCAGLIYFILLIFAPSISGTHAWLIIGSFSIQLTEVTKVLAVISFACVYTDGNLSPDKRLLRAVVVLGVHAAGLVLVNELGTLIVISIIFVVLGASFLPSAKKLALVVLAGLLCIACLVGFSYKCYKILYVETVQTQGVTDEAATDEAVSEAVVDNTVQNTHGVLYNKAVAKAANVFYKIRTRFMLVISPESLDEYGEGYQAKMARKAMLVTGWLGTSEEYEQNVPVMESDYIFLYVLMRIGIIGAFIVLSMLMAMMMETVIKVSVGGRVTESAAAIGFICCIVVQSIITAASSAGLIPTVGLTFAFLSDGGSATVMNYIMTYFILFSMRQPLSVGDFFVRRTSEENTEHSVDASRGRVCRTE